MSTIHSGLINVLAIRTNRFIINTTDDYLTNPTKPEGIEIEFEQNTALDTAKKNIRIRLNIKIEAKKNKAEAVGLSGDFGFEVHFHVGNLEEFIIEKDGKNLLDRKLGGTLGGIVYSTVRGIVYERTSSTYFKGVVLPVIDPTILLESS